MKKIAYDKKKNLNEWFKYYLSELTIYRVLYSMESTNKTFMLLKIKSDYCKRGSKISCFITNTVILIITIQIHNWYF